ncbi:unnamed protein product [Echinostoma caproni]|uniref:Uncharacterized protein n=1 Tax=Echinostoma caproni TaxID=27848 RepID=A0A3P8G4D2_9TREM|nr:unnamed protein product [Echinostoma caproni]
METQKLIEYTERLTRGAQCTKVYNAPCARPVLRIHEAIVAAYVRLLGAVMGKVSNYLCKTEKILKNDLFLRSADDVALLSLQLFAYEAKVNTSDNYGGYNRIVVDDMGPALEIGRDGPKYEAAMRLALYTTEYAVRVMTIAGFANADELLIDTALKTIVEVPACNEKCMPAGHFG